MSVGPRIQPQDCPRAQALKGQPGSSELQGEAWYPPVSHTLPQDPFSPHMESSVNKPGTQTRGTWGKPQAEVETRVQPTRSLTGQEVVPRGLAMTQPHAVHCSSVVLSICLTSQVL